MKNFLLTLCVALFVCVSTTMAETVIYETGFESSDNFQAGPLDKSGATWISRGEAYPFEIKDGGEGGHGQILESAGDKAGEGSRAWISGIDFKGAGKVSVEFDIRAMRSGAPGYQANIHLGNFEGAPKVGPQGSAALVSLRGSGQMVVYAGDTPSEVKSFKDGEWMRVRIDADVATKKYSVSVNGDPVASDLDFRDPATENISSFGFTHYSASEALSPFSMGVDNVKITAP